MRTFSNGERVRFYGRPWGDFRAPKRWAYGIVCGTNDHGHKSGRYPVALVSDDSGADFDGEAYLVQRSPGGGALWYRSDDLRKVGAPRTSVANAIRRGLVPDGYTLTAADIGRPLAPPEGFGRVLPGDVGKRCWVRPYGFVMENNEQRDARKLPRFGGAS